MTITPVAHRRRLSSYLRLSIVVGVVASSVLVWQTSRAAFTDETVTGTNTVTAAAIDITNEKEGQVLMSSNAMTPNTSLTQCVTVTYTSAVAATVKIYAKAYDNTTGLADYLTIKVEEGTGGGYDNCGTFATATTTIPTEPLTTFGTTRTSSVLGGAGNWAPASTATIDYRITINFPSTVNDNDAMGDSVDVTFGWTAQSS
jgi:hypothetical protein